MPELRHPDRARSGRHDRGRFPPRPATGDLLLLGGNSDLANYFSKRRGTQSSRASESREAPLAELVLGSSVMTSVTEMEAAATGRPRATERESAGVAAISFQNV